MTEVKVSENGVMIKCNPSKVYIELNQKMNVKNCDDKQIFIKKAWE